jgi:hypothetical protein
LLGSAFAGDLIDQASLCFVGPGPGANFLQTALINIDDDKAPLVDVQSPKAPDQVCTALLKLIEEWGCKMNQRRTGQCRQAHPH